MAVKWMRICSPIKLTGEIIAGLLRRLQLCMKYLSAELSWGKRVLSLTQKFAMNLLDGNSQVLAGFFPQLILNKNVTC